MLDKKLQLKDDQTIALIGNPVELGLTAPQTDAEQADAVLVFAANEAQLRQHLSELQQAAQRARLTWVAYPKAKLLDTDLNRDIVRAIANENGLDPVRQIAIDDTWSALRLKQLAS
ncbi:MAG TPA: hypothetical protein VJP80_05285 [Candidatus Saccharimonadales bacterium]|nr:hypothetical protein [Candidatus Saccharimonadales bacterium]